MKNNEVLVLCSGGLDSVVAAARLRHEGLAPTLLLIEYGAKAQTREIQAVKALSMQMDMAMRVLSVPINNVTTSELLTKATVTAKDLKGHAAWVPARNLILLSLATSFAIGIEIHYIAHGNIADGVYPDNKMPFTERFNELLPHATGPDHPVQILGPVNHLTKADVVRVGYALHVPFQLTWSCYLDGDIHCGECASCTSRRRAFETVGYTDPVQYAK